MANVLPGQLATRLRSLLRSAAHPRGASGTPAIWRAARDHWLDTLDPRQPGELGEAQIMELIDFLSEAGPSASSRRTQAEWTQLVDALAQQLLFFAAS